jgi:predicted ATPase
MQSRSAKSLSRWKRRVADLINPDAAKLLTQVIPELRTILGVKGENGSGELALESTEAAMRLKSILGRMFSTFAFKNKPCIIAIDDLQWSSVVP